MVNQDIVNYLREGIKRGFSVGLLRQKLLEGGFQERDVSDAINSMSAAASPKSVMVNNKPSENKPLIKKEEKPVVTDSEGKKKIKWMKVGAWCGVGLIVFSFIYSLLISFFSESIGTNLLLLVVMGVISLALSFVYYYGFIQLGNRSQDKLLKISAIIMIVTIFLIPVAMYLLSNAITSLSTDGGSGGGLAIAAMGLVGLLLLVSQIMFSIGLIKVGKDVRFSKGAGFLNLIFGILLFVITLIFIFSIGTITNLVIDSVSGGAISEGLAGAGVVLVILALGTLLAFLMKLIAMILEIFTLFEASNRFEK